MSHDHDSWVSSKDKKWLLISIILNSGIVVAEFIGWIMSWSLALLSDAVHNLSDVVALLMSFIGEILHKKESDQKHTFAFKRAEVIIAFVNSLALLFVWGYIIYEAIQRFFEQGVEINSSLMLWIAVIWFIGNFVSIFFLHKEKDDNLNKKSAYLHLLFDTISSVIVIIWWILIYYTHWYIVDLIASIIISLFVLRSWWSVLKSSLHILMQGVPENIQLPQITDMIKKADWVREIHDLHVWNIDTNDMFLSAHVIIEKDKKEETIIKQINQKLKDIYHIEHTSLQVVYDKCC